MNVEKNKEFFVTMSLYLVLHEEDKRPEYVPIFEDNDNYISIDQFKELMEVIGM